MWFFENIFLSFNILKVGEGGKKTLKGELMSYVPIYMVNFQIHVKINVDKEKVKKFIDDPLKHKRLHKFNF